MVVENNGREDWVTPNIPVEAPPFLSMLENAIRAMQMEEGER